MAHPNPDLATINRYLLALAHVKRVDPAAYHTLVTELASPLNEIAEIIGPMLRHKQPELTHAERVWKAIAQKIVYSTTI